MQTCRNAAGARRFSALGKVNESARPFWYNLGSLDEFTLQCLGLNVYGWWFRFEAQDRFEFECSKKGHELNSQHRPFALKPFLIPSFAVIDRQSMPFCWAGNYRSGVELYKLSVPLLPKLIGT